MSDELTKQKFDSELGSLATVKRDEVKGQRILDAGAALNSIGLALQEVDAGTKACQYTGSAAIHIFTSEILGEIIFVSQVHTLGQTPELIADKSLMELGRRMMAHYGRKPKKLRSGF